MAMSRIPGPIGVRPETTEDFAEGCVAGATPNPVGLTSKTFAPLPRRFSTDVRLLQIAMVVPLLPEPDRAVFYAEEEGGRQAEAFVCAHRGYTRLDELLGKTAAGRQLWDVLRNSSRPWSDFEEVWWALSRRLAHAASGVVHVFGPKRLTDEKLDLEQHRHKIARKAFANTVFEKVEWPVLEQNEAVTTVYYNGKVFGDD